MGTTSFSIVTAISIALLAGYIFVVLPKDIQWNQRRPRGDR